MLFRDKYRAEMDEHGRKILVKIMGDLWGNSTASSTNAH